MPTYHITAPDGGEYEVSGPGSEQEALQQVQSQYQAPAPQAAPQAPEQSGVIANQFGPLETAAHFGSSMIAAPASGIAGLGAMGLKAMGADVDPASVVENVGSALTYQPRTDAGKATTGLLEAPLQQLAKLGDSLGNRVAMPGDPNRPLQMRIPGRGPVSAGQYGDEGSPLMGTAISTAVQSLPALLLKGRGRPAEVAGDVTGASPVGRGVVPGKGPPKVAPAAERAAGLESVPQNPITATGIEKGYIVKPSEAGGKIGAAVEGLTGSGKFEAVARVKNQKISDRLGAEEVGLPATARLTPEAFDHVKQPHNRVYREVGEKLGDVPVDETYGAEIGSIGRTPGTSFPDATSPKVEALKKAYSVERFNATDAVLRTRKLRNDANQNIRSRDPEAQELGYAQLKVSDAIESQMERHGQAMGQGDLITRFRAARQSLAKINSLQRATKNGEVDVAALGKQLERGVPLSGNLKLMAQFGQEHPNVTGRASRVKQKGSFNMADAFIGLAGASTMGPAGVAAFAARPIARRALMSERYQNSLVKPQANALAPQKSRNALREKDYVR